MDRFIECTMDFLTFKWSQECFFYLLRTGLGFGIVLGSAIIKLPQILSIMSKKSAGGLLYSSILLEMLNCLSTVVYATRKNFEFSVYGESVFLLLQNMFIFVLMLHYNGQLASIKGMALFWSTIIIGSLLPTKATPDVIIKTLVSLQTVFGLLGRVPIIVKNLRSKSTGSLSFFTYFATALGGLIRFVTFYISTKDVIGSIAHFSSALCNIIIAVQIRMYKPTKKEEMKKNDEETSEVSEVEEEEKPLLEQEQDIDNDGEDVIEE
ncbi:hypothetical protein PCE1_002402 [Barthelona sp. PCE]